MPAAKHEENGLPQPMTASGSSSAQPSASSDWQPIDTAPMDGTIVQLWSAHAPKSGVVAGGYDIGADLPWRFVEYINWRVGAEYDDSEDPFNAFLKAPTHWRPLDQPPKAGG